MRIFAFRSATWAALAIIGAALAAAPPARAARVPAPDQFAAIDPASPLSDMLDKLRNSLAPASPSSPDQGTPAPASPPQVGSVGHTDATKSGGAQPIIGLPEPDGHAITGRLGHLRPSEQLAGRETALRFRFQQQLHSGERPWLPRSPVE